MTDETDLDRAIRELSAALVEIGWKPLQPPADPSHLAELESAIGLWRLPDELRRFFAQVDVHAGGSQALDELSYPALGSASNALELWRDRTGDDPSGLLCIGYTRGEVLAMEMDHPEFGPGFGLWQYYIVGDDIKLVAPSIAAWLDEMTAGLRRGEYHVHTWGPADEWQDVRPIDSDRVTKPEWPTIEHPSYGKGPVFNVYDREQWPRRWRLYLDD